MHALLALAVVTRMPVVELRHVGEVVALWTRAHDEASWRAAAEWLDAHADSADLAQAAVVAWINTGTSPPTKRDVYAKPRPEPLSDADNHLLHAIDVALPLSFDRGRLLFQRGVLYYHRVHLDDAVVAFQAVVDRSPSRDLATFAANMWLDSLNLAERYPELLAVAVRLRVDRALLAHSPDLPPILARLYAQGERMWIRGSGSEADHVISAASYCATVYMDAFHLAPDALPERDELLFEAALCSYKDGDRDEARARFSRLRSEFPTSTFLKKVPNVGLAVPAASGGARSSPSR